MMFPSGIAQSEQTNAPRPTAAAVQALEQASWREVEDGFSILRAITQDGLLVTAYRISPNRFSFQIGLQANPTGSRAREIGERTGAVLVVNGGFFASRGNGELYPIGYLRVDGKVLAKGWPSAGGLIVLATGGPHLLPSHGGIPKSGGDVLQSRPMLIEPGGRWAMGSNLGEAKLRTMLCRRENGEMVVVVISRRGLSLFEAGWIMRNPRNGGFFGCDSAIALDGGRSTQVWYADDPAYSYSGLSSVQNFLVVLPKQD